jgi:hypothetical protein
MVGIRNVRRSSVAWASTGLVWALLVGSAAADNAPGIPPDVRIPVELTAQITSQTAHVGDTFTFKTTKDETLGTLAVPAGTPGTGRLAIVQAAHDKQNGSLALQADSLQLATGALVWVNIDPSRPPTGHLSDKHTRYYLLPLPIGIVPGTFQSVSGNMVLDPGTAFRVVTIAPRTAPAPLLTAPPTPLPSASPAPAMPPPSPAAT